MAAERLGWVAASKGRAPMSARDRLRLAVQKSGRLAEPSRELLARCGLSFRESRDRLFCYGETLPIDLLLVRDDDIPGLLQQGVCDLGIVGRNVLAEALAASECGREPAGMAAAGFRRLPLGIGRSPGMGFPRAARARGNESPRATRCCFDVGWNNEVCAPRSWCFPAPWRSLRAWEPRISSAISSPPAPRSPPISFAKSRRSSRARRCWRGQFGLSAMSGPRSRSSCSVACAGCSKAVRAAS